MEILKRTEISDLAFEEKKYLLFLPSAIQNELPLGGSMMGNEIRIVIKDDL